MYFPSFKIKYGIDATISKYQGHQSGDSLSGLVVATIVITHPVASHKWIFIIHF